MNNQPTAEDYRLALKNVIDPEIYQNIVDLGLVYGVDVSPDNAVTVTMTLTTPHCPLGPQILENVEKHLRLAGASGVKVEIVWEPLWSPAMMTDELKRQLGLLEEEEPEPDLLLEPPVPPSPKKKSLWQRIFG